jgi:hypothetical protein
MNIKPIRDLNSLTHQAEVVSGVQVADATDAFIIRALFEILQMTERRTEPCTSPRSYIRHNGKRAKDGMGMTRP